MMPHPRRAHPAENPRAELVRLWLRCYGDDPAFADALEGFYGEHAAALSEIVRRGVVLTPQVLQGPNAILGASLRVVDALRALYNPDGTGFAQHWKLTLVPEALDELCTWLHLRAEGGRTRATFVRNERGIVNGLVWQFDDRQPPETTITVQEHFGALVLTTTAFLSYPTLQTDEDEQPIVRRLDGNIAGVFDPEHETPRQAKRRLRRGSRADQQFMQHQVETIADAYERAGWKMPDTQAELGKHVQWLYRRVVRHESCATIAATDPSPRGAIADDVRTRTRALAQTLSIEIPVSGQ